MSCPWKAVHSQKDSNAQKERCTHTNCRPPTKSCKKNLVEVVRGRPRRPTAGFEHGMLASRRSALLSVSRETLAEKKGRQEAGALPQEMKQVKGEMGILETAVPPAPLDSCGGVGAEHPLLPLFHPPHPSPSPTRPLPFPSLPVLVVPGHTPSRSFVKGPLDPGRGGLSKAHTQIAQGLSEFLNH